MHDEDHSSGVPEDAVVLSQLHIVEFMDSAGELWKADLSCDESGNELPLAKALELSEWAKAIHTAPMIADIVHSYVFGEEDEEGTS